jgi:DnaJ-class molecular chaperone
MTHYKPCPECEGQGTVTYERVHSHNVGRDVGFIEEYEDACENCDGTGQIEDDEDDEEEGNWLLHKLQDDYGEKDGQWLHDEIKDEEMDHD